MLDQIQDPPPIQVSVLRALLSWSSFSAAGWGCTQAGLLLDASSCVKAPENGSEHHS